MFKKLDIIGEEKFDSQENDSLTLEKLQGKNLLTAIVSIPSLVLFGALIGLPLILVFGLNVTTSLIATILAELVIVMIAIFYTKNVINWKSYLRLHNFDVRNIFTGVFVGVFLWVALQAVSFALGLTGNNVESSDTSQSIVSYTGLTGLITMVFIVPFFVPFAEELFFRGMLLRSFEKGMNNKYNKILAIVFSSVLFGLAHFQGFSGFADVFVVVWITLMSIIMGYYAMKTDSIWTSFSIHATYNFVTILFAILLM